MFLGAQKGQRVCDDWAQWVAEDWIRERGVGGHQYGKFDICGRLLGG
jgi:hypothetical protein